MPIKSTFQNIHCYFVSVHVNHSKNQIGFSSDKASIIFIRLFLSKPLFSLSSFSPLSFLFLYPSASWPPSNQMLLYARPSSVTSIFIFLPFFSFNFCLRQSSHLKQKYFLIKELTCLCLFADAFINAEKIVPFLPIMQHRSQRQYSR